jgi:hypothetical protein
MAYMNCPACDLAIRTEHRPPEECPRCRKRDRHARADVLLAASLRLLTGPILGSPQASGLK